MEFKNYKTNIRNQSGDYMNSSEIIMELVKINLQNNKSSNNTGIVNSSITLFNELEKQHVIINNESHMNNDLLQKNLTTWKNV